MKIVLLLFLNGLLAERAIPLKSWDLDSSFDRNYYFSLNSCLELAELGTKAQKIGTRKVEKYFSELINEIETDLNNPEKPNKSYYEVELKQANERFETFSNLAEKHLYTGTKHQFKCMVLPAWSK